MTTLPFDPLQPPANPPPGCPMPTLWRIAYALHQRHSVDADRCPCGARAPCAHRRAALRALLEACGVRLPVPRADVFDLWHGILLASTPVAQPTPRTALPAPAPLASGPTHLDTRGVNSTG